MGDWSGRLLYLGMAASVDATGYGLNYPIWFASLSLCRVTRLQAFPDDWHRSNLPWFHPTAGLVGITAVKRRKDGRWGSQVYHYRSEKLVLPVVGYRNDGGARMRV